MDGFEAKPPQGLGGGRLVTGPQEKVRVKVPSDVVGRVKPPRQRRSLENQRLEFLIAIQATKIEYRHRAIYSTVLDSPEEASWRMRGS